MESNHTGQHLERVRLENDHLSLDFVTLFGSKIYSLINKKTGRQWLDRPAGREWRMPRYGSLWEEWDRSGWDELFPSIDACAYPEEPWRGGAIPDHGEVWSLPWVYGRSSGNEIDFTVHGPFLPYRLEKKVTIQGSRVVFHYRLSNLGSYDMPFVWAPHPVIAATASMRICLPDSVERVVTTSSTNRRLGQWGDGHSWPEFVDEHGGRIELSVMPGRGSGVADKFYVKPPLSEGWCSVVDEATGERFKLSFDVRQVPYLAVWVNGDGWNNEYHLALEPATGYLDNLSTAFDLSACSVVRAGSVKEWDLTLDIS